MTNHPGKVPGESGLGPSFTADDVKTALNAIAEKNATGDATDVGSGDSDESDGSDDSDDSDEVNYF